ncbi:lipoprotein [Acetobacter estunensis NRIC 0472]|uniref:Outer membrane protein assembly factor BamE n=1 Tax=Acetobacter estunensis TaxID=104097 RepID=A0A967B8A3_9PROT|nr:outer membrane protein assembly factor BamE [Acetobacter estunensis]NHO54718.1 outer membrane protein assembly factor BamE [Acetobacter estunensis]GBQ21299.1 lipoprotein [Acetobacter estunensis NRIC 0472]
MISRFRPVAGVVILSCALTLAACATSGNTTLKNETDATIDQKIHDGVTTRDQVRALFGPPLRTTFTDSGHEEWEYSFTKQVTDGENFIPIYGDLHQSWHGHQKNLTVIFDGNVVWHHAMNTSPIKTSSGLF